MSGGPAYLVQPGGALRGTLRVPGDKSISHRAVMLAALAEGTSDVHGFLPAADTLGTLAACGAMGVRADRLAADALRIEGAGLHGLRAPAEALDCGNSGTAMRLLAGVLAGQRFASTLTGDASLLRRPMGRVLGPLRRMGARIRAADGERPPLAIEPCAGLAGIAYALPVPSAQVKSCVLLAGLYAQGETRVTEPAPTRDHTERMLRAFGYAVTCGGGSAALRGGGRLAACAIEVPADLSSAAFFLVGAAIAPGSELTLTGVGINPTRTGVLAILRRMGADIGVLDERTAGAEPVADLRVRAGTLRAVEIGAQDVALAIDEIPALAIAAACAQGVTRIRGAAELRVKESDRIAAVAQGLRALGVACEVYPDGLDIEGGALSGGTVESLGDHRIAMAFAMAALRASGPVRVRECANVGTSFPGFAALAARAGLDVREVPS
jgi:3-phosphoshikimate 1-carboxyvinyltransferase